MSLTIETDHGPLSVGDEQLLAIVRHADRCAALVAETMKAMASLPTGASRLPPAFFLELGAVLLIGVWERNGVAVPCEAELPSFDEAKKNLAARAGKGPEQFQGPHAVRVSHQVLRAWLEWFAWDAPALLQADVVLGDVDEDQFADLLAEFLWQHRHQVARLLPLDEEKS
jgi:hypothetical protein